MKVAISACLLGRKCRYDGSDNLNSELLSKLDGHELIQFCPEDAAFGTPRPTMDLIDAEDGIRAICNETGVDRSDPIIEYAEEFFAAHPDIELFIGKDRSPSCGVHTARLYDTDKSLISQQASGLMAAKAIEMGIKAYDAEKYVINNMPV